MTLMTGDHLQLISHKTSVDFSMFSQKLLRGRFQFGGVGEINSPQAIWKKALTIQIWHIQR